MNEPAKHLSLIKEAFSIKPLPLRFFSLSSADSLDLDIPQELKRRIAGRAWTQVTLLDWRMISTSPMVVRRYIDPAAFMYYVPSILLGVCEQVEFMELALEGIIPDNMNQNQKGEWWFNFLGVASPLQKEALGAFLSFVRLSLWDEIGPANQHLLERAQDIWKPMRP